ncbi:MAG: electron transfer flavoprotein subunit beta/FixA family protein [Chloroflexi bacterium]|nr:electron transfer flavoprotein subunit beta/FixA family protein [Chloroflexota bacterium]
MNILVCIKRIPATGGKVSLTADEQEIDTRHLGFTVSPHEECAVEEAVRLIEANGGSSAVLTLGAEVSTEQLRDAMAMGIDRAILLETDGREWDAGSTAAAIVEAVRADGMNFDLLLFGNEAADTGDYQVGIRVAHALGLPCVTGIKSLEIKGGGAVAKREASGGWDIFEIPLPAVVTVKEGINLPRYPSFQGRLKAKKKDIARAKPQWNGNQMEKARLKIPKEQEHQVEILGNGPGAAPKAVEVFQKLGLFQK